MNQINDKAAKDEVDFQTVMNTVINDTCTEVYSTRVISSPAQSLLNTVDK